MLPPALITPEPPLITSTIATLTLVVRVVLPVRETVAAVPRVFVPSVELNVSVPV